MDFKVKKIKKDFKKTSCFKKLAGYFGKQKVWLIILLSFIAFVLFLTTAFLKSGTIGDVTRNLLVKSTLETDEFGHTNILLLGIAGAAEQGGHLSDSILIASINPRTPSISLLSLPRDLFVSSEVGDRKINEVYAAAQHKHGLDRGLDITKKSVSDFTGINIHYSAVINFQVFSQLIDDLGGVDIFVRKDIEDPFYPDDNYGYQTFVIRSGMQHLNGDRALKYARSRKMSSDYDRAQRQQDLLLAIKEQAQSLNLLSDYEKLTDFYKTFKANINTDLDTLEVVALAKIGIDIDYKNVISTVLNDDPSQKGGFLYVPAREFYGGQFVLLPKNLIDTQKFMELTLMEPEVLLENAQISILNGSKISGEAGKMAARLRRFGFHIIEVSNYESPKPIFLSFFYNYSQTETSKTQDFLNEFLHIKEKPILTPDENNPNLNEQGLIDLQIVIGSN